MLGSKLNHVSTRGPGNLKQESGLHWCPMFSMSIMWTNTQFLCLSIHVYDFPDSTYLGVMYVDTQHPNDGDMLHLVVSFLMPCVMATACVKKDACEYVKTRPQGVPSMTISMRDIYPRSCDAVCSLTDGCVAVTLDPSGTMCYFFNESDDLGITQDPGATLVLFQAQGVPCIEVSWMTIYIS